VNSSFFLWSNGHFSSAAEQNVTDKFKKKIEIAFLCIFGCSLCHSKHCLPVCILYGTANCVVQQITKKSPGLLNDPNCDLSGLFHFGKYCQFRHLLGIIAIL